MYLRVTIWAWKKDVLIGATACLTGSDSVGYDENFFYGILEMERETSRDFCFKAYEYEGIFACRGEYLFSCSG
jgi:hypothetical protein